MILENPPESWQMLFSTISQILTGTLLSNFNPLDMILGYLNYIYLHIFIILDFRLNVILTDLILLLKEME